MEPREQRCEACGTAFGCGADVGRCWCDEVTLDAATLARLRARFGSCLCPSCLRALAARTVGTIAGAEPAPPPPAASIAVVRAVPGDACRSST